MHRFALSFVLLAFVASGVAAAHEGVAFRSGENYTFRFSIGPIEAGRARMVVGAPNHGAVKVRGQAEVLPALALFSRLNEDYQLTFDAATLLPTAVQSMIGKDNDRSWSEKVNGHVVDLEVKIPGRSQKIQRHMATIARDPISALFALRALALADGDVIDLDVMDGPAMYRGVVRVFRGQKVQLNPGERSHAGIRLDAKAIRIDEKGTPIANHPPRMLTLWLADDADRSLLEIEADSEFGKATLVQTSFDRGKAPVEVNTGKLPALQVHK